MAGLDVHYSGGESGTNSNMHVCQSEENIADVLTKALPNPTFHALVRPILFRVPGHVGYQDMILMRTINNQD